MRLKARKPISLRGKILGGENPLICTVMADEDVENLQRSARIMAELCPDVIEWRSDYYQDVCDAQKVKQSLITLRSIIGSVPLMFTLRSSLEGGYKEIQDDIRYEIIKQAIYTGEVDAVDIELSCGKKNIEEIKAAADEYDVPLILSYHDFSGTPSVDFLLDKMRQQISNGADIPKISVMARTEEDVLNLLTATLKARLEMPDVPIITVSMGDLGIVSRIAGGVFGSDLTYCSVGNATAPGQIHISEMKAVIKALSRQWMMH